MVLTVDYVFTREYLDNNRINLQHCLWTELFGYLMHPKIPTTGQDMRIADVGTGTGIWLTALGAQLPASVHLDGLDISFEAMPPSPWLPSNVTPRYFDIIAEVPKEFVHCYDIVHVRNFAFVLQDNDIHSVLENLIKLLKPGGYLQWAEPDVTSFRVEKTEPENDANGLSDLMKISQRQDARLRPTWVPKLPALFADCKLEGVEHDVRDAPPYLALAMHECNLPIHGLIAQKTGNEVVAEELGRTHAKNCKRNKNGLVLGFYQMGGDWQKTRQGRLMLN